MKTDLNNEKVELNFKIKEPHSLFAGLFFTVFAYRSGFLNWAQKSGNSQTLGTKQEVIHKKWQGSRSASTHHTRPRPWLPWGQWCQAAETALNQRAPFGSSHVEKIRPIFSFQKAELLTQKVTASRSTAMMVYIPIREKQKTRKARVVWKLPAASWPCK